jgi:hypothetical protein
MRSVNWGFVKMRLIFKLRVLVLASLAPTILSAQTSDGLGEENATIRLPTLRLQTPDQ